MARCFLTGVELPLEETWLLDIAAAYRTLKDLRERVAALDRLIQQLSPREDVEIYDPQKRETFNRKDRRLINAAIAKELSAAYPGKKLFMSWSEWRARRHPNEGTTNAQAEQECPDEGELSQGETPCP